MSAIDRLFLRQTESELRQLRTDLDREIQVLQFERERIENLLSRKRSESAQVPTPQTSHPAPRGDTRRRIIAILDSHGQPLSPKQIMNELSDDGGAPIQDTQVYNVLSRMAKTGDALRKGGRYELPSRNGTEPASANGSHQEPLAEATSLAGGYGEDAPLASIDRSG